MLIKTVREVLRKAIIEHAKKTDDPFNVRAVIVYGIKEKPKFSILRIRD